jgi:hypothetical protein
MKITKFVFILANLSGALLSCTKKPATEPVATTPATGGEPDRTVLPFPTMKG